MTIALIIICCLLVVYAIMVSYLYRQANNEAGKFMNDYDKELARNKKLADELRKVCGELNRANGIIRKWRDGEATNVPQPARPKKIYFTHTTRKEGRDEE